MKKEQENVPPKRKGVSMPSHNLYDHDEMVKLYAEYRGTPRERWEKIAKILGCNFITVRNVLKKRGVKMKLKWGGSRKHTLTTEFHQEQVSKNKKIIQKYLEYSDYTPQELQHLSSLKEYSVGQIAYCLKLYKQGLITIEGEKVC